MSAPNTCHTAQRIAAEQLAWWRRNGVTAREASAGIGMFYQTDDWEKVERALIRKWRGAAEMLIEREENRSAA